MYEVAAEEVKNISLDCILFQSRTNYLTDQYEILSAEQRELPKIYLEHDPPRESPTDTRHIADDPEIMLVHVTHFNRMMWDNNSAPTRVIDHGVIVPEQLKYSGKKERGIVVINNIHKRGRRLGLDLFLEVRKHIPVDLIGMGSEELGMGEIKHIRLPEFISQYRFFFNPIRYTSLGLSVCEAMMLGIPVVGMATTEMVTVINNGSSGYIHTDLNYLIAKMKNLLNDKPLAERIGREGKKTALRRFNISRFTAEWEEVFRYAIAKKSDRSHVPAF